MNVRSVNNKALSLHDYITTENFDIIALTETWLSNDTPTATLNALVPNSYCFQHCPRTAGTGGGVGLMYRDTLRVRLESSTKDGNFSQFEHMEFKITNESKTLALVVVYRPPNSSVNEFLNEMNDLLDKVSLTSPHFIVMGDMNFHLELSNDKRTSDFNTLLQSHDLKQFVQAPTHIKGHTLDAIIARNRNDVLSSRVDVVNPGICNDSHALSMDHFAVIMSINMEAAKPNKRTITYRPLKNINKAEFSGDLRQQMLLINLTKSQDDLITEYSDILETLLDKHAPKISREVLHRPNTQWYTEELREAKREKRKSERRWRKTRLEVHHQDYQNKCIDANRLLHDAKQTYYSNRISECGRDQRKLHQITRGLLGKKSQNILPMHTSDQDLANEFNDFFLKKIHDIRSTILSSPASHNVSPFQEDVPFNGIPVSVWSSVSEDELRAVLNSAPTKQCSLDPIPTAMLKENLTAILPIMLQIVNKSLEESLVPVSLKEAVIHPKIKKDNLDQNVLSNYRPISNLPFMAKILEKIVSKQLDHHLNTHGLHDVYQSAYRQHHSTELALLKVQTDIMKALDKGALVVLVMTDLSAAFDTLDHNILLHRLENTYGFHGGTLTWFKSYLSERQQHVRIGNAESSRAPLHHGVPQGSILGPKLYTMYTKPVSHILSRHCLQHHCYADDTQVYRILEFSADWETESDRISSCLGDVQQWMDANMLKFNQSKTEYVIFHPKHHPIDMQQFGLSIGGQIKHPCETVRNLGVMFDAPMTMEPHVTAVARSCRYYLRSISKIRNCLSQEACQSLISGLVFSRLDYCNALLSHASQSCFTTLQRVQNSAARLITRTGLREHMTPVLQQLHWLPVRSRIRYKVLLICHKTIHGSAPAYMNEFIEVYTPGRDLRSQNEVLVQVSNSRTTIYGQRRMDVVAAKWWNELPRDLRYNCNRFAFKRKLKTFLFSLNFA